MPEIMNKPPFEQLAALLTFAECGSVVAAAEKLGISQPALSAMLARLEKQLPFRLFQFNGPRKTITPEGETFINVIAPHMRGLTQTFAHQIQLRAPAGKLAISVGARREVIQRLAGRLQFPGKIHFHIMGGEQVAQALRRYECDVGILQTKIDDPMLESISYLESSIWLCVPKNLSPKKKPTVQDFLSAEFLRDTPFLAYKKNPPFFAEVAQGAGFGMLTPNTHRICDDWPIICEFLRLGEGFTFLPEEFIAQLGENIWRFAVSPQYVKPVEFYLTYQKQYAHVPAVAKMIELCSLKNW